MSSSDFVKTSSVSTICTDAARLHAGSYISEMMHGTTPVCYDTPDDNVTLSLNRYGKVLVQLSYYEYTSILHTSTAPSSRHWVKADDRLLLNKMRQPHDAASNHQQKQQGPSGQVTATSLNIFKSARPIEHCNTKLPKMGRGKAVSSN